jgi:hypothetical protein
MTMVKLWAACFLACFLLGLSCPTPESFPPPPLSAPVFSGDTLIAAKFDTYRPSVHLTWKEPRSDSLSIREFVILQNSSDSGGFSILVRSIPDTITEFYDNLDRIVFPQPWDFRTIKYRIFAIDTLGRSGDTSGIDSVALAWPPVLLRPADNDSVLPDSLAWSVSGVMSGFFTYVYLYSDDSGLVWKSPRPDTPIYSNHDKTDFFATALPPSLSLTRGASYYWAVKVEIPTGSASSLAISRFYVR